MPRRLGASVPQTVSRLLQGGLLTAPPPWYEAVSTVAPLRPTLLRKIPPLPTSTDGSDINATTQWKGSRRIKRLKSLKYKPPIPSPLPGFQLSDNIRKSFFKDHPFEAFRGVDLVETDTIVTDDGKAGPTGKQWEELSQRSRNPSPEEYVFSSKPPKKQG